MGYIISENGNSYLACHARAVSHKVVNINGKKKNILFKKDVGFGEDTNAIDFSPMALTIVYGGVPSDEIKDIISRTIPTDAVLDLSDVPVVNKVSEIPAEGRWLYVKEHYINDVFADDNSDDDFEYEEEDEDD